MQVKVNPRRKNLAKRLRVNSTFLDELALHYEHCRSVVDDDSIDLFVVRPVRHVFHRSDHVSAVDILNIPRYKPLTVVIEGVLIRKGPECLS